MIRFFLHGWYLWVLSEGNKKFFLELLEASKKREVRILIIPFARVESRWEEKKKEIQDRFSSVKWKKEIHVELAEYSIPKMVQQIRENDIILLWWWATEKLQNTLALIENLKDKLDWKIVAWSSAGTLVFSKYYYENDTASYHNGLALISVGMICHWKNQEMELAYIKKYWWVDEILCIPEWEYIIREC